MKHLDGPTPRPSTAQTQLDLMQRRIEMLELRLDVMRVQVKHVCPPCQKMHFEPMVGPGGPMGPMGPGDPFPYGGIVS